MAVKNDILKRSIKIEFASETDDRSGNSKVRRFNAINTEASKEQLYQLAQAISKLTPNGDDNVTVNKSETASIYSDE